MDKQSAPIQGREQQASGQDTTGITNSDIQKQKDRIDKLWSAWKDIQKVPELVNLFDRKKTYTGQYTPEILLSKHHYPVRSKISDLPFEKWTVDLNPKFIKEGHMYLLRGDHPNLENEGFYSRPFAYGKKSTLQLTKDLKGANEVDYFLQPKHTPTIGSETYGRSIADQLGLYQSQVGGSSFISTTTSLRCAWAGTDNQPNREEQSKYEIYVMKIPTEFIINTNIADVFIVEEDEYLIPDFISPSEILTKFKRDHVEAVYEYMNKELGVTREDLGMSDDWINRNV